MVVGLEARVERGVLGNRAGASLACDQEGLLGFLQGSVPAARELFRSDSIGSESGMNSGDANLGCELLQELFIR